MAGTDGEPKAKSDTANPKAKEEYKKGHADLGQQLSVISDRIADVERRLGATPAEVAGVDRRATDDDATDSAVDPKASTS